MKQNESKTKRSVQTEELTKHLQTTTIALIQEKQIAIAKAEREKLINKWIERINNSLDPDEIIEFAALAIGDHIKANRCGILLFDSNRIQVIETSHDHYQRQVKGKDVAEVDLIQKVIKSQQFVQSQELKENEEEFFVDVKSFVALPLIIRKETAAVVYLQHCDFNRAWSEDEIDLLESFMAQLSIAIEKAKLYRQSQKRTNYAELLNKLTTQIRSSLNLDEILKNTVNELGEALHASRCFLYFDSYVSEEYCAEGIASVSQDYKYLLLDKLSPVMGLKTIAIDNLLSSDHLSKLNDKEKGQLYKSNAVSALATPLHFQGILQGWIVFHSLEERIWEQDEINFIEAAGSQVIVAMTQSRMYQKLTSYQDQLSRELKQAARVQTALIGGDVYDVNLDTSVFYKAHSSVSGDFYWVAELAPDKVGVLIGDVSGKGPAAALLTGYLLGEFNAAVSNSSLAWFPDKMIDFLCSSILYQNASSDFYATAWYGVYDLSGHKLTYTNAGHLNPYIIKDDKVSLLDEGKDDGVPLGLLDPKDIGEVYEARELEFKPGDKMILFTDGLLDQQMPGGEFVPKDWVQNSLIELQDKDVKEITYELNERLNELSAGTSLSDDRLMICLEQVDFKLLEFPAADTEACAKLIDKIISECKEYEMPQEKTISLKLGLTEALSNCVRYGLRKNPYGNVSLGYKVNTGSFKIAIDDPGPGFNWQVYSYKNIEEVGFDDEGGRGLPLLKEIFDKVTWNYLGNHLGLFYYW